ncbi:MAG: tyrosine-type recombinase/integrase [Bacteroidota bacterium]
MAAPKINLTERKTNKGTIYFLDYRINGKRVRQSAGRKKSDAEIMRAKLQNDFNLSLVGITPQKHLVSTLEDLTKEFLADKKHHVKPRTLERYRQYKERIDKYFTEFFPAACHDVRLLDAKYLREFIDQLFEASDEQKPLSKKTINDIISFVKSLFNFAVESKYLEVPPTQKLKEYKISKKGKVNYFSDAEIQTIFANLDKHWVAPIKFILHTGLRRNEMIYLKWTSVFLDPANPHIIVESHDDFDTKTGNTRVVPLNSEAVKILEERKGIHGEYVFTDSKNRVIHRNLPLLHLNKALKKAGVEGNIHKLRHTFASNLVMKGVDIYSVGKLLGHTDVETTMIYAHLSPHHLLDAVKKLEQLNAA